MIPDRKKILVVDDDLNFRLSFAECLTAFENGVWVRTVENGEKALEALEADPVDLVITDLRMPVMDGYELVAKMRDSHPAIPVIVMSAVIDRETERRIASLKISQYFDKSEKLPDILEKISCRLESGSNPQ